MPEKELVDRYVQQHKAAWEQWPHGEVKDVWIKEGIMCIRYQDGTWYHYRETEDGLEWW